MGMHGQTHVIVVPYLVTNGKPTEDFPMGRLQGVTVDIEGASVQADFEVIEIFNDINPYPTLLGIDWAIDMNSHKSEEVQNDL